MNYFDEREQAALTAYCTRADMSEEAALRHAFRLFQTADHFMAQGMEMCFRQKNGIIVRPFFHDKLASTEQDREAALDWEGDGGR